MVSADAKENPSQTSQREVAVDPVEPSFGLEVGAWLLFCAAPNRFEAGCKATSAAIGHANRRNLEEEVARSPAELMG